MKRTLLSVLLICILLLSACGTIEEPHSPEPSLPTVDISAVTFSSAQVMLSEIHDSIGAPYGLKKTLEVCEYEGTTYAFEPQIPYEDRAECIGVTNAVLDRVGLGKEFRINLYTAETYGAFFTESGSVYTHVQDWKSPEYIVALLYGLLGDYCHYGTLYGYANYLCGELLGTAVPEDIPQFEGGPDFLDLNLLCFRPEFISGDEAEQAKLLANTFVRLYIETCGEQEFLRLAKASGTVEGTAEFQAALSDFYKAQGIDYTPTGILYRPGGMGYDFIVKCPYAVMYVERDWVDKNKDLCPYTYDNFLHENYGDVKQYFTVSIGEFGQFRELFGLYPYNDDLNIYFTNHPNVDSQYLANTHSILIQNTASLGHEYIHSTTHAHNIMEYWAMEGFARYFSYYYNYYGNAMSTVDLNALDWKYILEYKAKLGRDIDMNTDFAEVYHLMTWCNSYDDPNDGNGYVAGASFIDYLISQLGEKKTLEIIGVTHDFGAYTYENLVSDWQNFLAANYSEYTQIK